MEMAGTDPFSVRPSPGMLLLRPGEGGRNTLSMVYEGHSGNFDIITL